jgi:hypothetical protein
MLNPQFPYKGNQVIISSGRVTIHSKSDAIFLFGKQGVGISTPMTFNVDAPERTIINSNLIELGLRAKDEGQPILKGNITLQQLNRFFNEFKNLANAVKDIANSEGADSEWSTLAGAIDILNTTAVSVNSILQSQAKSTVTYTK